MSVQNEIKILLSDWKKEKSTAETYRLLSALEPNDQRKKILLRLTDAEERHAKEIAGRIHKLGGSIPVFSEPFLRKLQRKILLKSGTDHVIRIMEMEENRHVSHYEDTASESSVIQKSEPLKMAMEERVHSKVLHSLAQESSPQGKLDSIFRKEHWHSGKSGGWIGQAVYGANDGLGAVFGIVSGMAGYAHGNDANVVWIAGIAGTLASALSMGSGAYLSRKSEREVYEAEIERERREIEQNPDEEKEELQLFYELKGFTPEESKQMALRLTERPDQFLKTLVQEELGLSESSFPNPLKEAASATLATAVGGIIPVIPFLFWAGLPAVVISLSISTIAHFLVGVLKTIVTGRSWWRSGLEMTLVGLVTAAIAYGVGMILSPGGHSL